MKVAIYPGSFNPFHKGHADILRKTLCVFDAVTVAIGVNPDKVQFNSVDNVKTAIEELGFYKELRNGIIIVEQYDGLLVNNLENKYTAVVRGFRNGSDIEQERIMQYWNEDLNITIPTAYFMCDRNLVHISSSAIRSLERFKT